MSATIHDQPTILIASCSIDRPTWEPVAKSLTERGYVVVPFAADDVALGQIPLTIQVGEAGLSVTYNHEPLLLRAIRAAWFRRPAFVASPRDVGPTQVSLDSERRMLQAALWAEVPESAWLNTPDNNNRAELKLSQLRVAQQCGFVIPSTVVGNDWDIIQQSLPAKIICKASRSLFFDGEDYRLLYTTPFTNESSQLPLDRNPYPGIWQPFMAKAREWRITVVGDDFFDAAVYTAADAKDDWRKHQRYSSLVEFRKEQFPDIEKQRCLDYLRQFGLRFGAFDFIEDDNGRIIFLECNPNGQFMWLEHILGLPISAAVTDLLAEIARQQ